MAKKKDYTSWDKDQLIEHIAKLEKRKKYGLVWDEERTKEKFEKDAEGNLPVLKEVKGKAIENNPDKPTHILIEGDNYHALSVLNYTHENAIDVIYIDPPYNTGNKGEWKYNDNWVDKNDSYRHSKWLSFVSKRLQLAKNLLSKDGVIFISIDDNEYAQLKLLCDEIFTEDRYVGTLVWEKKKKGSHLNDFITNVKEYVLVYCKDDKSFNGLIGEVATKVETYPCVNPGNSKDIRKIPKGIISKYKEKNFVMKKGEVISAGNMFLQLHSDLVIKDGELASELIIEGEWRYSQEKMTEMALSKELYLTTQLYIRRIVKNPRHKKMKDLLLRTGTEYHGELYANLLKELENIEPDIETLKEIKENIEREKNASFYDINYDNLYEDGWGSNEDGDNELRDFFGKKVFDFPKPTKLIQKLIASTRFTNSTILDFFAGTGSLGDSILKLNETFGLNNKFILCTNNEDNNDSGLKIATDICYPRIQKVITGYKKRNKEKVEGIKENLKYFKTTFVPGAPTDTNREKLTRQSVEMLCLREGTFNKVNETEEVKVFKSNKQYTAILFDEEKIDELKKQIAKFDLPVNVYVFSLGDEDYSYAFEGFKNQVKVCSIPEAILRIYRRIFQA